LLEGKETPNPGGTAMITILNGCTSLSDLQNKKTDFFLLLRSYKIEEELFNDYYNPIYHEYNIISNEISEKISSEIGIDVTDYLKVLNYVSIHRKDLNVSIFENIKYVLLTGNSTTFKISLNELIKKENSVPLATTLTFLINKFWFKLTRGLGKSDFPKSFDIITKSQIILSKILNNTLSEKFEEYKSEFKQGKLTEEQAIARIVNLRECVLKPEEINDETVNEVLSIISEDSINKYVEENSYLSIKNKKQEEENRKLEEKLIEKDFIEKDLFETKRELILSKEILFSNLLSNKNVLNEKVEKRFNDYKKKLLFTLIILGIFIFSIVNYFQWDFLEKYTYLISFLPVIVSYFYTIVKGKSFNFLIFLNEKKLAKLKSERQLWLKDNSTESTKKIQEIDEKIKETEKTIKKDNLNKKVEKLQDEKDKSNDKYDKKLSDLDVNIKQKSYLDPQLYLLNELKGTNETYPFFPGNLKSDFSTPDLDNSHLKLAKLCVDYQIKNDFEYLVIPTRYFADNPTSYFIQSTEYFVTPFCDYVKENEYTKKILLSVIQFNISFLFSSSVSIIGLTITDRRIFFANSLSLT
jgi:hypothetical protein